jgi:eukaryotic-like serine/threonine-protein kinase
VSALERGGAHEGPAARLVGMELAGGWRVIERLERPPDATGGLYSVGYLVEDGEGREAFMKAHDYSRAIRESPSDFSSILEDMLSAHNFERDLNDLCTEAHMSRVVQVLAADGLIAPGSELPVNYLIFELAEGDIRDRLADFGEVDLTWNLRTCHQTAIGLGQLHRAGIIHQDLKPSNLMDFGEGGSKIGDLGNGWRAGRTSPLSPEHFGGDPEYAPPECLYGFVMEGEEARLKARDLYMFGSVVLFLFSGVDATCALAGALPPSHRPRASAATFEQALPHLIEATDRVAEEFEASLGEGPLRELGDVYRELCDPDPRRRGHPLSRLGHRDPYSLERYVSLFDLLANVVEDAPAAAP